MKKLTALILLFLTAACSGIPKAPEGFVMREAQTEHFAVAVWEKTPLQSKKTIRFYIEGNGNPKPNKPVALRLAENDKTKNIVVLSRPCQYIDNKLCANSEIYTTSQYDPEITRELEEIVVYYIQKYRAPNIELIAYDGGAPIAFYLADKVGRVKKIVTIAGILDLDAYVNKHNLPEFKNAENPIKMRSKISDIPQTHFVGGKDTITTQGMVERFVSKLNNPKSAVVKVAPNMGHTGWENIELSY